MVSPRGDIAIPDLLSAGSLGRRRAILILGMHRSGTSSLTKLLGLCGGDLPTCLLDPNFANAQGYWEPAAIVEIHDEMLVAAGSYWGDSGGFPLEWLNTCAAEHFRTQLRDAFHNSFGTSRLALLKDPRICRFIPLWISILESLKIEPLFVIPVRNPLEVAASLIAREKAAAVSPLHARGGMPEAKALLMWLRHFLEAERQSRGRPRSFVNYEQLLEDWRGVMAKIEHDLAITLPVGPERIKSEVQAYLSSALRHQVSAKGDLDSRTDVTEWVKSAYHWAELAAAGHPTDSGGLDQIHEALRAADQAFLPIVGANEVSLMCAANKAETLTQTIAEKDSALTACGERERRLEAALAEKESALTAYGERERRLKAALAEKESTSLVQLAAQDDSLAAQMRRGQEMEARLRDREEHLQWMSRNLAEHERTLAAVYCSTSWRLSAPIRWGALSARPLARALRRTLTAR